MKKRFSTLTVVIIGFLMMAVGVGATAGYIDWAGSQDFEETKVNHSELRIQINELFGVNENLESTKDELESTNEKLESTKDELQDELDRLEELIDNSGNDDIESLIDERDELNTKLVKSQEKINEVISSTNSANGKGPRYDELKDGINGLSDILSDSDTGAPKVNENHGNGPKSNKLKQAEKDMEDVKEESSDLLEFIESGEYDEDLTEPGDN